MPPPRLLLLPVEPGERCCLLLPPPSARREPERGSKDWWRVSGAECGAERGRDDDGSKETRRW